MFQEKLRMNIYETVEFVVSQIGSGLSSNGLGILLSSSQIYHDYQSRLLKIDPLLFKLLLMEAEI
jgi:hypothetical protein